uniref:Uncharacterized protein n=1 Tax=Panagrolaimus superbus TaxID=310955 RepID=A0A914YJD3_9BILA
MYKFLGLFAIFTVAFGCFPLGGGGGGGEDGEISDIAITSEPTFELSYSPPVEWTAPVSGVPEAGSGQMKSLEIATAVARKMIQNALLEAMIQLKDN